ncbi:hypothetical protein IWX90DRAFT_159055 [Phyllosticta citrichinensis]|uniref:SWIM-type domain-containing protein n=1 Tax=Phyllosticta citrichinensis TaxID=1130410 RepID=A0ABR1Y054_9PEZI
MDDMMSASQLPHKQRQRQSERRPADAAPLPLAYVIGSARDSGGLGQADGGAIEKRAEWAQDERRGGRGFRLGLATRACLTCPLPVPPCYAHERLYLALGWRRFCSPRLSTLPWLLPTCHATLTAHRGWVSRRCSCKETNWNLVSSFCCWHAVVLYFEFPIPNPKCICKLSETKCSVARY